MSLVALSFCVGIMCFGVYAATSVSYTLSGHITYDVSDVFVDIETRHYLSTETNLTTAKGEVPSVMSDIASSLESGTTSIDGVTELISDRDEQSSLNNVGGENLPLRGSELNITYGAYSNTSGEEKAYVHYIAILVTNYAEEEINAILDLDSLYDLEGSNSAIYPYRTMENIPAKSGETNGVMSYVFALGLDQPAQSADVDFSGVSLSVTRGNLDQYATEGLAFEYSETDGGYLVSDYTGTDTRVIVPSIVPPPYAEEENQPKNVVGTKGHMYPAGYAFDRTAIRDVYLPKTFKTIGGFSFSGCSSLTSITIPESVESIGDRAFYGCQFESVTYSTTDNSTYDFVNGTLTIRGEVSDNPAWYSANINPLVINVVFSDRSITSIGSSAFDSCSSLTSITIPNSVESIGNSAFDDCQFESVSYSTTDNSTYDFVNGTLTIRGEVSDNPAWYSANINPLITNVVFSDRSITSIGDYAFSSCSLTSTTIPNSVISIGDSAFYGCSSLTSITIPNSVKSIGDSAFLDCQFKSVTYSTTDNSTYDFVNGTLTIRGEVSDYPAWYEANINQLITNVVFGKSDITSIGDYAFDSCHSLTSITIPNSVESIGSSAFHACFSLTSINISSNVSNIKSAAFMTNTNLNSVIFEDTTTPWTVNPSSTQITSTELSNPSTMATYLTSTYVHDTWTKNV